MANRELPENISKIVDSIHQAGAASDTKVPHSGNIPVADGGERPYREFGLHEATESHPNSDPAEPPTAGTIEQGNDKPVDSLAPVLPLPKPEHTEPTTEAATSRRKRGLWIALGTAAASAGIITATVLGLHGDKQPNEAGPNPSQPVPTNTNTDKPATPKVLEPHPAITTPLAPEADTALKPLTETDLQENHAGPGGSFWEKEISNNIPTKVIKNLNETSLYGSQVGQNPNWHAIQQMFSTYTQDAMAQLFAQPGNMERMYNDTARQAYFYGHPQNFHSPKTAELIGPMASVPVSEFAHSAKVGNMTKLYDQAFPDRNIPAAYVNELAAGNTDPALIKTLVDVSLFGNQEQGTIQDNQGQTNTPEQDAMTMRETLLRIHRQYLKDPKATLEKYGQPVHTKTILATTLNAEKQITGFPQLPLDFAVPQSNLPNTLTGTTLYRYYTYTSGPLKGTKWVDLRVVAWPTAPVNGANHEMVTPQTYEFSSMEASKN